MTQLRAVLDAYRRLAAEGQRMALATVVEGTGAVYRRPGARMLVSAAGETVGCVGAGCLERDVVGRALRAIASGSPTLATYDTTSDNDIVWGLGLGCRGVVHILIEPLDPAATSEHLAFLAACLDRNQAGALATVFRAAGPGGPKIGARVYHGQTGVSRGDIQDDALAEPMVHDVGEARHGGPTGVREYRAGSRTVAALIELIQPPIALVIFGAEPSAVPVARLAVQLGWRVTVADTRPGLAVPGRFPGASVSVVCPLDQAAERLPLDARTAVVIMTQHYLWDMELLRTLLLSPVCYVGLLGPRERTEALLADLGPAAREQGRDRLYAPIGLDIGAETPEEIALAIIAEIQAAVTRRSAGFLRDRPGRIHDHAATPAPLPADSPTTR